MFHALCNGLCARSALTRGVLASVSAVAMWAGSASGAGAWPGALDEGGRGSDGSAQDEFVLIDRRLEVERARVVGMDDRALRIWRGDQESVSVPIDRYVAMVRAASQWEGFIEPSEPVGAAPSPRESAGPLRVLELVDGQRLYGRVGRGSGEDPSVMRLEALLGGVVRVPLERVSRVAVASVEGRGRSDGGVSPRERVDDVVVLDNGDELAGFVVSIGRRVRVETEGVERVVPLDVIREIVLATERGVPPGPMVWLPDGSVVAASVRVRRAELLEYRPIAPTSGSWARDGKGWINARLDAIPAIALEPARLRALAGLELIGVEPGAGRRWVPTPTRQAGREALLGAGEVELGAPMRTRWRLPAGASRLACTVVLPERSRLWGDCEVVVGVGEGSEDWRELAHVRVHAGSPEGRLSVELPAGSRELVVELRAGRRGPIQDRVVLRRGLVLLEE